MRDTIYTLGAVAGAIGGVIIAVISARIYNSSKMEF